MEKIFQKEKIIEEKDSLMVSPTGGEATLRKARFINPISSSGSKAPVCKIPSLKKKEDWPFKVTFNGWPKTLGRRWPKWVKAMQSKHSHVWEKAGILEPIMCSNLKIKRNDAFLFSLVENWSPDSNTFRFAWGEATVTLEDVMVLGGFSVLGDPVLLEREKDEKLVEIRDSLEDGRKNFERLVKDEFNVDWLYYFMGHDCPYEHEAFLCLWLLTCVFPGCDEKVFGVVFELAVWLARGRRFALGPCVLASLYRDLGVLKGAMADSDLGVLEGKMTHRVTLWSPMYLVQVWGWERFPSLQPEPNVIGSGNERIKRWHGKVSGSVSESGFNSAGIEFVWRPYAVDVEGWSLPKFYVENEVFLKPEELSLEFESFFRCLRASVLIGVDCQEQYSPHRVAMQFGFDQEIPGRTPKDHVSCEIGWSDYIKPLNDDDILFVPSRHFVSNVTTAYLDWWRTSVLCPVNPTKNLVTGKRSCGTQRESTGSDERCPSRRVNTKSKPGFEYKRSAPANPKQIVKSINGLAYINLILNKEGSVSKESKQPASGSSSNVDEEAGKRSDSKESKQPACGSSSNVVEEAGESNAYSNFVTSLAKIKRDLDA